MNLPQSWNSILVDQYIELRELENSSLDYLDKMLEVISIVTDTDIDELEELSFTDVTKLERELYWLRSEPSKNIEPKKYIGWNWYFYKGLDSLTLGEFIDLNHFFSDNFVTNLPTICAILYRKQKKNEWGELMIEPYDYDPKQRAEHFLEIPITEVYGIIPSFLDYKENFENTYKTLFKPDLSDEPIEDLDEETKKEIEEEEKLDKFSWERLIYTLTNGDITKTDRVLNLSVVYVFNVLSMKKALDI